MGCGSSALSNSPSLIDRSVVEQIVRQVALEYLGRKGGTGTAPTLTVLASVGGVFADNADTDPSKLLSRADDAMYGVKWSRRRERRSMMD